MKLYVISGLGADGSIFEYIQFPKKFTEIIYIDWLIPNYNESFENYVNRMAEKVVILGSIKSDKEMSITFHLAKSSRIFAKLPESYFSEKTIKSYAFFRKLFDPNNPKLWQYFKVQNPTYLKWSINKILEWKHEEDKNVIQILADKDIVFPVKNSKPNYVIKGGTHLFPVTKAKEVSKILEEVFSE